MIPAPIIRTCISAFEAGIEGIASMRVSIKTNPALLLIVGTNGREMAWSRSNLSPRAFPSLYIYLSSAVPERSRWLRWFNSRSLVQNNLGSEPQLEPEPSPLLLCRSMQAYF